MFLNRQKTDIEKRILFAKENINLIDLFESKEITAKAYEKLFLITRDRYLDLKSNESFEKIYEDLFWAVEDYCSYPEIRGSHNLDEIQLLERCLIARDKMQQWLNLMNKS